MKKTVHIISHTHWDREWYLNSKFVNRWLPVFFESLFAMMEKEKEYRFVLDGQTSILDDCYVELERDGGDVRAFQEKIRKYAGEGRLILGPYYLQPDWQLISEEALVRNMLYGKEIANAFGSRTKTGWLLDNFGQISQAPQIHKQFGMKGIVVWRGVEFDPEQLQSEFYWKSPDGTVLPGIYLLSSYRNAMRLADYPDSIYGRIKNEAEKIEPFATTGNILLMNGYDQEMLPDDILPYIRNGQADFGDFKVVQSTPDEYMEAVTENLGAVQTFSGALYSGRYISVFPGVLSSRMYLKMKNDTVQRQIECYAEPLLVMSSMEGQAYPGEQLDECWKLLLKNHPHDSICGVSVDDVHTDMEERFEEVSGRADGFVRSAVNEIAGKTDTSTFAEAEMVYQIFNTVPVERVCQVMLPWEMAEGYDLGDKRAQKYMVKDETGAVLPCQKTGDGIITVVKLPPFGYAVLGIYREQERTGGLAKQELMEEEDIIRQNQTIENKWIQVSIHENGSMDVLDKTVGKLYKNIGYLEECGDGGDEYNFSYIEGDAGYTTLDEKPEITVVEQGTLRTVVQIQYRWKLPARLGLDRRTRSGDIMVLPVTIYMTLETDSPVLKFRTVVKNRCKDHRIRVMFPTDIEAEESLAHTQFDVTPHPVRPEAFDNSRIPEDVSRIIIGARESEPITQFPQREFVAVTDGVAGAAVLNRGLPEYEVLPEHTTVALTLFRSVGWLARADLNTRIGDAGPEIFTPDAQCLRDMEFHYGFCPFGGSVEQGRLMEKVTNFNQPALTVRTAVQQGVLPARKSWLSVESAADAKVTAVKRAQDGQGMILRCYHAGENAQIVKLCFGDAVEAAFETNLAEENLADQLSALSVNGNQIDVVAEPNQIVTLRIILKSEKNLADRGQKMDVVSGISMTQPWETNWKETSMVDASQYEMPAVVTASDCLMEENRAMNAEAEYQQQLQEHKGQALLHMKTSALHRAALEARLSSVFTYKKYQECLHGRDSEEFQEYVRRVEPQIRELADQLNAARIDKRVSEYRLDYYLQLEKEQGGHYVFHD